jgi:hypothetical protein
MTTLAHPRDRRKQTTDFALRSLVAKLEERGLKVMVPFGVRFRIRREAQLKNAAQQRAGSGGRRPQARAIAAVSGPY